ncbi:MAG: hypothetical protein GX800_09760 [Clostridiaceae bacterium]|nr:hypothetical protein [Clostridiaceae bacterium]
MGWTEIIIAILTGGTLSGIATAIVYRRENRRLKESEAKKAELEAKGSDADVADKSASVMKKMFENAEQQQTTFNAIILGKDELIEQQRNLIDGYKCALDEANQKLKGLEFNVGENNRKIIGMQKTIDNEIRERKLAESSVCFVRDCAL